MDKRIIDLSEGSASLSVRNQQLRIVRDEDETTVPLEDVAILIVSHPAVHYTHAVLAGLLANGGGFIVCDGKRLPSGMLLPLSGHSTQTERFATQVEASLPTKKQVWKQLVTAKITAQAELLEQLRGEDFGLRGTIHRLRSGDSENVEGQAARRYWPALFGPVFRRQPGEPSGINSLLNYGYAVLRAIVVRAVCSAGLHPSLGVHHHNRYDPFCLADDLMEPMRPAVDYAVYKLLETGDGELVLDRRLKGELITGLIGSRFCLKGEWREPFDAMTRIAASLFEVYSGKRRKLLLPTANRYEKT